MKKKIIKFKKLLLVAIHVTEDQPTKSSKILNIKYNSLKKEKGYNIFVENKKILIIIKYYKRYILNDNIKIIYKYLLREVNKLVIYYL